MTWMYKGEVLTDEMIPDKSLGFIYLLTHKPTGKRYIGRKLLTKMHVRQKNKKKIRSRVENDWRDYWSSSPEILAMIEAEGTEDWIREVLVFAPGKGILNYLEEKFQHSLGVLETDAWWNSNIRAKYFRRLVINKFNITEVDSIINSLKQP